MRSMDERLRLLRAVMAGDEAAVRSLLAQGRWDVNQKDADGNTALHHACHKDYVSLARRLLDAGARVDVVNKSRMTALHFAAFVGAADVITLLAHRGAKLETKDSNGCTALFLAAYQGNRAATKRLLGLGANVSAVNNDGFGPLHAAAQRGDTVVAELLLRRGADMSARTKDGRTALFVAVLHGHGAAVRRLLDLGADANAASKRGDSPLFVAAGLVNDEVVESLLSHGADVSARSKEGCTALFVAALQGTLSVVERLLAVGAKIDAENASDSQCASLLLDAARDAATIDLADDDGCRAIHYTADSLNAEKTKQLLEAGAAVNGVTKAGVSPLDAAVFSPMRAHALSTIRVLCEFGAEWTTSSDSKLVDLRAEIELRKRPARDELARQLMWCEGVRACVLHWEQQRRESGKELINIPIEVIQRGDASVKTYLADVTTTSPDETRHRSKVCVVGPSEWGKSSLVRSVEAKKPFLVNSEDRTIGIDLWSSYLSEAKPVDFMPDTAPEAMEKKRQHVTFWDFAGQDVYQVAHSLFYSRRTQYVLVIDVVAYIAQLKEAESLGAERASAAMDRFLNRHVFRWVRIIFSRQTDAEFLVLGTKADLLTNEEADCSRVWQDLQNRVDKWKKNYVNELNDVVQSVAAEMPNDVWKSGPASNAEGPHVRELKQKLDHLASDKWLVVSVTRPESIVAVRSALQKSIELNNRGFPMGSRYSRVLDIIVTKREAAKRPGDVQHRIDYTIVSVADLCTQLMAEIRGLEIEDCRVILRTLHDLGDVIWYESDDLEWWKEFVILDPLLVLDVVREVINHDHAGKLAAIADHDDVNGAVGLDGFVAHDLLKTFPLWKDMDDYMGEFKILLNHFQLAYPAVDSNVLLDSDLIVPTYWKSLSSKVAVAPLQLPLLSESSSSGDLYHCWEFRMSADVSETIFDQFAVASHSSTIQRVVRANGFESMSSDFQGRVTLRPLEGLQDIIRIEIAAYNAEDAWSNLCFYVKKLEKVLRGYPGLTVFWYVLKDGKTHSLQEVVDACEGTKTAGTKWDRDGQRQQYLSIPPNVDWYIARVTDAIVKFEQLQLAQQMREKLATAEKLVVKDDWRRRYPARWSVEFQPEKRAVVVQILSDLTGKCFHDPIHIAVPSLFLAERGSKLSMAVSLTTNIVDSALSVPILREAIPDIASRLGCNVHDALKIHRLVERLNLSTITDSTTLTSEDEGLSPNEAQDVVKDLLGLSNDGTHGLSISKMCELDCAVTEQGHYVWAHDSEISLLEDLTLYQPESEPIVSSPTSTSSTPSNARDERELITLMVWEA